MVMVMMVVVTVMMLVFVVVVIVMVMLVFVVVMVVMMLVFVVVMVMMMLMLVIVVIVVMMLVLILVVILVDIGVQLLYPCRRGRDLIKIEIVRIEDLADRYLAADGLDDLRLRLESADDLFDIDQFFLRYEVDLVEDDRVAELDLLDQQVLDILVVDIILQQRAAAAELRAQASRVDNGNDIVQTAELRQARIVLGAVEHGDGLRNRDRLTDAGRFDQDVIELLLLDQS